MGSRDGSQYTRLYISADVGDIIIKRLGSDEEGLAGPIFVTEKPSNLQGEWKEDDEIRLHGNFEAYSINDSPDSDRFDQSHTLYSTSAFNLYALLWLD